MVKNASHTLAYSLVALQEMNLAFKFPIIFWNCACLITDSGGGETEDEEVDMYVEDIEFTEEFKDYGDEDDDEDDEEEEAEVKKKKKIKTTDFGKISTAINKMRLSGIEVSLPDINKSTYTFSPDVGENLIRYGLSGITKVGEEVIKSIIENRPYDSISDFLSKVKLSKPQMVNLIKAGAFDSFGERSEVMDGYIRSVSDQKKRITLQNMKMLIDFDLLPPELDFQVRVFNFNKYLKKNKIEDLYLIDDVAMTFYEKHFTADSLIIRDGKFYIKQSIWDKIYSSKMDVVRKYIKDNSDKLLTAMNNMLISEVWNKYCEGNYSKWEMDSVSFYWHPHELLNVDQDYYNFSRFSDMSETPEIDRIISMKGKQVPLFKIHRIIGTVINKDKMHKSITLLTPDGDVVTVKIYGAVFTVYDKQISERGADGKKHVLEKSIFSRGNKVIVSGIRTGANEFLCKKYKSSPWHLVERIDEINEDGTIVTSCRAME